MDYDIFKDDEARAAGINDLAGLMEHPGWKWVLAALDKNIEHFDGELHDTHFIDLRPIERLQDRVSDLRNLKLLPTLLMEDAKSKLVPDDLEDGDDVFDSSTST